MHNTESRDYPVAEASIDDFKSLAKGEDAPTWCAEAILAVWHPGTSTTAVRLIAVSENVTFIVTANDLPAIVVRLSRPGYAGGTASLDSELAWIEAIRRETDVRTPPPVRGADGNLVQVLTAPTGARWNAVAFQFVEGTILEEMENRPAHFAELGQITARLHTQSRGWPRPDAFSRFDWRLTDLVGATARWGDWRRAALEPADVKVLESAESTAVELVERAGREPRSWGLIHADLRPSNILVSTAGLSIIDFDDAGHSWFLYDFAAALSFYEHKDEAGTMASEWLSGYSQVSPLTTSQRQLAGALSMLRRLTMLGWTTTHRSDALPPDLWNEMIPGTVEVGVRYIGNPQWLVG